MENNASFRWREREGDAEQIPNSNNQHHHHQPNHVQDDHNHHSGGDHNHHTSGNHSHPDPHSGLGTPLDRLQKLIYIYMHGNREEMNAVVNKMDNATQWLMTQLLGKQRHLMAHDAALK